MEEVKAKLTLLAQLMWETVQGVEEIAPWEYPRDGSGPAYLSLYLWPYSVDFRLMKDGEALISAESKYNIEKEEWE